MLWLTRKPSHDRDWTPENAVMARLDVQPSGVVRVHGVRNFRYRSTRDYDAAWEEREYHLDDLATLDFLVAPFSMFKRLRYEGGKAHTFVSFGFGEEHLAVSIEVRRTRGETFGPIRGMFRAFEIIYIFGDERDVVGVRTAYTRSPVYLFRIDTSRDHIHSMFLEMAARANALADRPEFYNTLTNTCTTNLVRHVHAIAPGRIPVSPAVLLPGYSARLLYRLGLIRTEASFAETFASARIGDEAGAAIGDEDYSQRIRQP